MQICFLFNFALKTITTWGPITKEFQLKIIYDYEKFTQIFKQAFFFEKNIYR